MPDGYKITDSPGGKMNGPSSVKHFSLSSVSPPHPRPLKCFFELTRALQGLSTWMRTFIRNYRNTRIQSSVASSRRRGPGTQK